MSLPLTPTAQVPRRDRHVKLVCLGTEDGRLHTSLHCLAGIFDLEDVPVRTIITALEPRAHLQMCVEGERVGDARDEPEDYEGKQVS